MKTARAASRRHLPSSPFNRPVADEQLEEFAVNDRVTHDKFGLGSVIAVEHERAVVVDFGTHRVRIPAPYAKLGKL